MTHRRTPTVQAPITGPTTGTLLAAVFGTLLAAGVLAPAVHAQGTYAFKKLTAATFGQQLRLSLTGMPQNRLLLFMLSLNAGPTPLVALIGQDSRSLEVGTDLLPLWVYMNSGSGTLNLSFPTPPSASLQGAHIHLQTMVAGTPLQIVDKISNKIQIVPGASGSTALLQAKLGTARGLVNIFPLGAASKSASGNDLMLAGGGTGGILGAIGLATSEVYDFDRMSIRAGPKLTTARALATGTVLGDGRVLLAGGVDNNGVPLTSAEIYDPKQDKFVATGSMSIKRAGHAAALLPDGRVLVAGGAQFFPDAQFSNILSFATTGMLQTAEIYDPQSGKWTGTGNLSERLLTPALTTLTNGKVLVSGGVGVDFFFGVPIGLGTRTGCQLFDPKTGKWAAAGSMKASRAAHDINTVLLKNGKVLATGGVAGSVTVLNPTLAGIKSIANAEVYDPTANGWTAVTNMAVARATHTATLMPDGKVILTGGTSGTLLTPVAGASVQEFDPTSSGWRTLKNLQGTRAGHGAAVTADGLLVIFGGAGGPGNNSLNTIEVIHQ
ncbi:MAG: Kelch repeat-containing protein [Planctomycetota bacterium]